MSKVQSSAKRKTVQDIRGAKNERKLACITCYDYAFARLLDRSEIDLVLVGDSLGNVILGHSDPIPVTLDDMIHHTKAVARGLTKPFLCTDLPFMTYQVNSEQALRSAGRVLQEAGAQSVKIEGGEEMAPTVARLTQAGIPVLGHLGLTPQSLHQLGGYKVQGRQSEAAQQMVRDAKALEDAGAFAVVLEMVPRELAKEVTAAISVPTIGIGAGADCDGQIIVLHDILGFDDQFKPKFLKQYADLSKVVGGALNQYVAEVREQVFPDENHSFS